MESLYHHCSELHNPPSPVYAHATWSTLLSDTHHPPPPRHPDSPQHLLLHHCAEVGVPPLQGVLLTLTSHYDDEAAPAAVAGAAAAVAAEAVTAAAAAASVTLGQVLLPQWMLLLQLSRVADFEG